MGNAGTYIYSGFIPLVKMGFTILAGFVLAKKGLFPPEASRGASQLAMTVSLPCLIFASVVPAFNSSNIKFLGPLVLNAFVYECAGLILGFIIREIFYVPPDFQYGIIIACVFSNWGNQPTAVVQTIATVEPFNPNSDPVLGVAYVSVFMLMYSITFFGLGTCKICAWDFAPRPEGEVIVSKRLKWAARKRFLVNLFSRSKDRKQSTLSASKNDLSESYPEASMSPDLEKKGSFDDEHNFILARGAQPEPAKTFLSPGGQLAPTVSRYRSHQDNISEAYFDGIALAPVHSTLSQVARAASTGGSNKRKAPSVHHEKDEDEDLSEEMPNMDIAGPHTTNELHGAIQTATPEQLEKKSKGQIILNTLRLLISPISIALFIALPIALITPLKALFTPVSGWTGTKIPNGPDGKPPLKFLLDTASFIGAVTIPVSLMLLGVSFARLKVPKQWSKLPIAAMFAVMIAKMVIVPVIGVGMTEGLSLHTSLYPKEEKMLKFVAMLLSGTPSAVNQLVITQIYSPDGTADTLSLFLMVQYIFMFVASAGLAAVALAFVS